MILAWSCNVNITDVYGTHISNSFIQYIMIQILMNINSKFTFRVNLDTLIQSTIQSFILCTFPRYYIIIYTWRRFRTNNVMQAQTVLHIKLIYLHIHEQNHKFQAFFFVYLCAFYIKTGRIIWDNETLAWIQIQ